jgi:hypothetical protein
MINDAPINFLNVDAWRLNPEFADLIREGYSQDSFYGDEGEKTSHNRVDAKDGHSWRLDRLYVS